jgi:hypothetical protein
MGIDWENIRMPEETKEIKFTQRRNPPSVLYKYRDWNDANHRKSLEGKLFFSSRLLFNDPFDGRVPISEDVINNSTIIDDITISIKRINQISSTSKALYSTPKK